MAVTITLGGNLNKTLPSWFRFAATTLYKYWLVTRATLKNYAPKLCNVALGPGRRPEGNITQLRGIIFQCWSRLTVNICFVISQKNSN